jgi:hypothetical protein
VSARTFLLASVLLAGCYGERSPEAVDEPLRASPAEFRAGALPEGPDGPTVTLVETANLILFPGQVGKSILGRATPNAASVALRFADIGTGHWVTVIDAPDPLADGERTWGVAVEVARDAPPGNHTLEFVAIDARGRAGAKRTLPVCIASPIPDKLATCDPNATPPSAVVSLAWDTNVDLDLRLVTPDGKIIDGKSPTGSGGRIDRDSNAACVIDGARRESIVFDVPPVAGTYLVYANLFDACEQQSVRFEVGLHLPQDGPDGGKRLAQVLSRKGQLLAQDANGGAQLGLYLTDLTFE